MKTNKKEFEKMADNSFTIHLTITKEAVQKEYQHALTHAQENFESKGFRKGKAPLNVVEKNVSQEELMEHVASHLLSDAYEAKVKENNVNPIIQPQVKVLNPPVELSKDWEVEITGCELPNFEINKKCFDEVKKINNKKEIVKEEGKTDKLDQIINIVIANSKTTLPPILVNADLEHRLSSLVDQITQAGTTVEQFLKNKNQTIEQYKDSIKEQIVKEWTLNLAIDAIFKEQKMEIKPEEGQKLLEKNPQLAENMNLVYYLLSQQKVFEYLQNLK